MLQDEKRVERKKNYMICTCVFMCSCFCVINILETASLNYLENVDAPACIRLLITIVLSFSVLSCLHTKCFFFSFFCRAEYGKYSVLVGHSGARKRENMSAFREMLMTEALNKVQSLDPETFKKKVRSAQIRLLSK